MKNAGELALLCQAFKKSNLKTYLLKPHGTELSATCDFGHPKFKGDFAPKTLYKTYDEYGFRYVYLLLDEDAKEILLIGPYFEKPPTAQERERLTKALTFTGKGARAASEYLLAIPYLDEKSPYLTLLYTFAEHIWQTPAFPIVEVGEIPRTSPSPITETLKEDSIEDSLIMMKAMEQRYSFENQLIEAVTLGQIHKEALLLAAFKEEMFEKRLPDRLRNAKNYCVIMNTLLRKAAEQGGVHPLYLDRVSGEFASRIEAMSSYSENGQMMLDIFRTYCRLVRKHSLKGYSPIVKKTILIIESDLSLDLSLNSLAEAQGISAGYLSAVFKKETGKTLTAYVTERRILHASHLLTTTSLQIQTVALHCGIVDVQYFSKLFRKHTGKSPREFRENKN